MKGFDGGCLEDAHHFMNALVLGDLHVGEEALLVDTCIPHLCPVGQHRDNKCVVYVSPIEKIETPDRVSEDTYPVDGGACVVGHNADMFLPFEVSGNEDPKVVK